jgi:hypothetical protein
MNIAEVFVKQNGEYVSLKGQANIDCIDGGDLLDEQLDELRLVIKNSLVEHYPPLTEFKIVLKSIENGTETIDRVLYMVVGNDNPTEFST